MLSHIASASLLLAAVAYTPGLAQELPEDNARPLAYRLDLTVLPD